MSEQEQPSETEVELELDTEVVEDSAEAPTENVLQEVTLESVQAELEVALVKVDEQQADVLRAQAEAQNIRRRSEQDVAKAHKFGQEKLMTEVVSLLCLNLPRPWRVQMPIAAEESVQTRSGRSCPRSAIRLWNPRPIPDPRITPHSSASPLLSVTPGWVLLQDLTRCLPIITHPPEVLLRVRAHPAQSVST